MDELFSGGTYLVIVVGIIAVIGGWVAIYDYISRNKDHKDEPHLHGNVR